MPSSLEVMSVKLEHFLQETVTMPGQAMVLDRDLTHGQVRQLSLQRKDARKVDLLNDPPSTLLTLWVWQDSCMPFVSDSAELILNQLV